MEKTIRKATRSQPKAKKKPIKVVYIANPVRLTATAGEFRAVVQRFTGRDACYSGADDAAVVVDGHNGFGCRSTESNSEHGVARPGPDSAYSDPGLLDPFKSIDEAFSSQLLEEFSAMYNNGSSGLSGYL
ncbi:sigma factor binding protein 1, chloroplastic-like [Ananas comosus]|uniref:Sigma factor binding protein 1, chloroplastic-like n=2 Tax=Ananas comosus TaxID=4615 RepID=A0A6P5GB32_ANACO|nr:sigma factor binding protein 1, chloroplastic-like [Ananas comosus]CAD1839985.1 unnamed protein product [Ananas comosus var. bracteatus]